MGPTQCTFSVLSVEGPDHRSLLQGLLTCDLDQITKKITENHDADQAVPAALCDIKGRVIANPSVWATQDAVHLVLPNNCAMLSVVEKHLKKYAVFSKVSLSNTSDSWHVSMAPGSLFPQFSRKPFGGSEQNFNALEWERAKIAAGWVTIYPETSGLFTPQMLGLEKFGAVSFNKGCYLGQEIVARTQHLGKLKRHLYQLEWAYEQDLNQLKPGEPVVQPNGDVIGTLVNSVAPYDDTSPQKARGLAVLEDAAAVLPLHTKDFIKLALSGYF